MSEIRLYDRDVCDFCSGPPTWRYPARDFVEFEEQPPAQKSTGAWLACDACASLIQRNEWAKLARRGLDTPLARQVLPQIGEERALADIMRLQRGFRRNRSGRVERYDPALPAR